jgi:glycosyltransferase involved in cell wall biosynthesis
MIYFHWITGCFLALIWLSRIWDSARGVPTLADISQPEWDRHPGAGSSLALIVPARNEQDSIEQSLRRLLALDCQQCQIIAVNDRSTDRTGQIMDRLASAPWSDGRPCPSLQTDSPSRLKVVHIHELPPGWMGKAHAMWTGARLAECDWILFTDADVMFRADCARRAVAYAEAVNADHLVLMPKIIMKGPGEKLMIGFFQLLFVFGHRPWKVSDPKAKDHIGVGAFNLVRRTAYEAIGTYAALKYEIVDDMKLGKVMKNAGCRQRVVFGDDLIEIRWAHGARGVMKNLTKNFFAVMSFQWWRAILGCTALIILNLLPFWGSVFAPGWARLPYAITLLSMFLLYAGMWRKIEIEPWYFLLHPLATLLFVYTILRSMFVTLRNGGVEWRGTFYPLDELRKGLV